MKITDKILLEVLSDQVRRSKEKLNDKTNEFDVYNVGKDKVAKVRSGSEIKGQGQGYNAGIEKFVKLSEKFPELCAKVYKITKEYIIMEKLDANGFIRDVESLYKASKGMCSFGRINWGIRGKNEEYRLKLANEGYEKLPEGKDKQFFLTLVDLLQKISTAEKQMDFKFDVHQQQFGYDKHGSIKLFDV